MSPTPTQVRQALQNTRQPSRTHGAKVRDAIRHTEKSRAINPAEVIYSTKNGVTSADRQGMSHACNCHSTE